MPDRGPRSVPARTPGGRSGAFRAAVMDWLVTRLRRAEAALVVEHACAPPPGYEIAVPSVVRAAGLDSYMCPECGQVFMQAALAAVDDEPQDAGASRPGAVVDDRQAR